MPIKMGFLEFSWKTKYFLSKLIILTEKKKKKMGWVNEKALRDPPICFKIETI